MRLHQEDLYDYVKILSDITGIELKVGAWNGNYHVYAIINEKGGIDLIISGSLRQCYDYIVAFLHGIRFTQSGKF